MHVNEHLKEVKEHPRITWNCTRFRIQNSSRGPFDTASVFNEKLANQSSERLSNVVTLGMRRIIKRCRSVDLGSQPKIFSLYMLVCVHGFEWNDACLQQLKTDDPLSPLTAEKLRETCFPKSELAFVNCALQFITEQDQGLYLVHGCSEFCFIQHLFKI